MKLRVDVWVGLVGNFRYLFFCKQKRGSAGYFSRCFVRCRSCVVY